MVGLLSQGGKTMEQIKIIVVEPDKKPEVRMVDDTVKTYQDIVGGHFQVVRAPGVPGVLIGMNEDGNRLKLKPNLQIMNHTIVGPIFFFGTKGEEFASLTDNEVQLILSFFD